MNEFVLGRTNISATPLALGTLTLGPFQLALQVDRGAQIIAHAVHRGINLLDTAKAYFTYPYVKRALEMLTSSEKESLHIIGRSYDYTRDGMKESFNEALSGMGIDGISIFMLHEVESELYLKGHKEAVDFLVEMKKEGKLNAVGISTHHTAGVMAGIAHKDVDVIFAILNKEGLGIIDGSRGEMEKALLLAHGEAKGIFLMKVLGGGHLHKTARESLEYIKALPFPCVSIVGMQDEEEVDYNISIFDAHGQGSIPDSLPRKLPRRLFVEPWCRGCGNCVTICPFGALEIQKGRVNVDSALCMLCSYCAGRCPDFCLKVV